MRMLSPRVLRGATLGLLILAIFAFCPSIGPSAHAAPTRPVSACSSETLSEAESTTTETYNQLTACTTPAEDAVITMNSSQPQSLEVQLCTQDLSHCTGFQRLGSDGTVTFEKIPSDMYILGTVEYDPFTGAAVRPSGKLGPQLLDFTFTINLFPVTFRVF